MRRSVCAVLSAMFFVGAAAATPQAAREATVEAETKARIIVQTEISSKLNEPGDPISAVLDEPLYVNADLVMPRGTEFIGRITQVAPAGKLQKNGQISIIFEQIRMSWGDVPVAVMLTAIDDWKSDEKNEGK